MFPLGLVTKVTKAKPLTTALTSGAAYGAGKSETDENASFSERAQDVATDALTGAAAGGLGYGALKTLGALFRVVVPRVNPTAKLPSFKEAVNTLENNDIKVTSAERIASKEGRLAERMVGSFFGQGEEIMARPQQLYSKLMEKAGFAADDIRTGDLSAEAIENAAKRFDRGYDQALRNVTVKLPPLKPKFDKIAREHSAMLPHEQRATIRSILDSFESEIAKGRALTGREYKRLRSGLRTRAQQASRSQQNNYLAPIFREMRTVLDDAFRAAARRSRPSC